MKYIPISTGLIEHCPRMREAVWLFIYIVDKQTKGVKDGRGQVLGGCPIRDRDIAEALHVSKKTVSRWRETLLAEDYITARRTPYGSVYSVSKPKKWQRESGQICPISIPERVDTNGTRVDTNGTRVDTCVRNKEERQERQEREGERSPDFPVEMEGKIWDYYVDRVKPGPNYSLTTHRSKMLAARHAEIVAKGKSPEHAAAHLGHAINAFAEDDYHMGRKKGYEGAGRKGIEEIFRTQEVFENWCSKYQEEE